MYAATQTGQPILPVFILDADFEQMGAAPKWRLERALASFAERLQGVGSRLILRRGPALSVLEDLIQETGATAVHWSRQYTPEGIARDTEIKSALKAQGLAVHSFPGFVLFEPWTVETGSGGPYKVFTPFWKKVRTRSLDASLPAPETLQGPERWPEGADLSSWKLSVDMNRGAPILAKHASIGEATALQRLDDFMATRCADYPTDRDRPDRDGTSGLAEHLSYGEISARTIWHRGRQAMAHGNPGAETFVKELVWRDFAWHLAFNTPELLHDTWRPAWRDFPWRADNPDAEKWRRGETGEPMVDAAMRELYVTGRMHNRARMLVASYLTKHLMTHWRVGAAWFADCLVDWDPASNAMGWQWAAGCGPDASPYFRVFNPAGQAKKFDPDGAYQARFLPFEDGLEEDAEDFYRAAPRSWGLDPDAPYPERKIIGLKEGRQRALDAYKAFKA